MLLNDIKDKANNNPNEAPTRIKPRFEVLFNLLSSSSCCELGSPQTTTREVENQNIRVVISIGIFSPENNPIYLISRCKKLVYLSKKANDTGSDIPFIPTMPLTKVTAVVMLSALKKTHAKTTATKVTSVAVIFLILLTYAAKNDLCTNTNHVSHPILQKSS